MQRQMEECPTDPRDIVMRDGVKIIVSDPIQTGNPLTGKSLYLIKTKDGTGQYRTQKRYKAFLQLRTTLSQQWPGVVIPALPPKTWLFLTSTANVIEKRRFLLDEFLKRIANRDFLYCSPPVQNFLKDLQAPFTAKPGSYTELLARYRTEFPQYSGITVKNKMVRHLHTTAKSLRQTSAQLQELEPQIHELRAQYDDLSSTSLNLSTLLLKYEEFTEGTYPNRAFWTKTSIDNTPINPFTILLNWCRMEILDQTAMLEAIKGLNVLSDKIDELQGQQQKLSSRKRSVTSLFKLPSKQKADVQVQELKLEEDAISHLLHLITANLYFQDVPKFVTGNRERYVSMLQSFSIAAQGEFKGLIAQLDEIMS